ncbi:hypothetical protein Q3G72_012017 [Acer saccharum]|nr:hypothetical protein Q3G72_012017 [Acer saccharum]
MLLSSSGRAATSMASSCDRIGVSEAKQSCCRCRAVVVFWLQSIRAAASIKSSSCFCRRANKLMQVNTKIRQCSRFLTGAGINNNIENSASRQGEGRGRIEECLVAVLRI